MIAQEVAASLQGVLDSWLFLKLTALSECLLLLLHIESAGNTLWTFVSPLRTNRGALVRIIEDFIVIWVYQ